MADFVTLSDLQAQVQKRADILNATQKFPLTDVTEQINKGWRRLYGILTETGERHYLTQFFFTTVAAANGGGAPQYFTMADSGAPSGTNLLPMDLYKVDSLGLAALQQGQFTPLARMNFETSWADNTSLGGWPWPWPMPRYDYQGSGNTASLYFAPAPAGGLQMCLWYFPVPPLLANAGDQIDSGNGWDIFVVDWAASRFAEMDENYELSDRLKASYADVEQRVRREAANRNSGQAAKIRRVRRRHGWAGGGGEGYGGLPGF